MINLPTTGLSNETTNINHISNDRKSNSTKHIHEHVDNHKTYPQRHNRAKLNYRDLERGMYGENRQLMWTLDGSTLPNKNHIRTWNDKEDIEVIDLSIDDDDDETSNDDTDQSHRRLWCICRKPWDHTSVMLRCDSCANWYHGHCIGITKEQAKAFEIDDNQFICPSCRGISHSIIKSTRSSDESILLKRKQSDRISPVNNSRTNENKILRKSISHDESTKRLKTDIHDSLTESHIHCIIHDCKNQSKSDWIYCSSACIRRHINDTLQAIQQSKGGDNDDIPTRDDILLYERKSKKILEKNLVPKIEDLSSWINQHPSYEIIESSSRLSSLLTKNRSIGLTPSFSSDVNRNKIKLLSTPIPLKQKRNTKLIVNKKKTIQVDKQINTTTNDIRSKVPSALYDKIIMRLEKNGEKHLINKDIRTIVDRIEQEMFRIYGKVDNSYKNKFRSLLANINNMNNNFFYKQILSKELTAKQIVAMKPEDMLPPEEKEKRKDQFDKEVQMIMNAEQQKAEEMERRKRTKVTLQGVVDNNPVLPVFNLKEQSSLEEEVDKTMDTQPINTSKKCIETKESMSSSINKTSKSIIDKTSVTKLEIKTLASTLLPKKVDFIEPLKVLPPPTISERSNCPVDDSDNDYIEPESPTGIDALIYDDGDGDGDNDNDNDDDDDDDDIQIIHTSSHSSTDNTENNVPLQQIIRDDYNPSKTKNNTPSIYPSTPPPVCLPNQWRGVIHPSDVKISCQSVDVYGESDYLIRHIPEQLIILGRLRLGDLWDYIHESLPVRDVLILTLGALSSNTNDNDTFLKYVDTMHTSERAAVISKCTNTSLIRDIYILAANTKVCPSSVLSSLSLPNTFETKQLFLVIIATGKRTTKFIHRSHENQSLNNLIYKPVALQNSTVIRDPRLLKNKDPRLSRSSTSNENIILPTVKSINNKQTLAQSSTEDLLKLISDSLERIRHSSTIDNIHSIVTSTTEILKSNSREDLCTHFTAKSRIMTVEWEVMQRNALISTTTTVTDDNLVEENMDVDEDQDDKYKKQIITSSTSNLSREFNDTDYRFLDQDVNHHITTTLKNDHQKPRRKSRFSDVLPTDNHRPVKLKSNISPYNIPSKNEKEKSTVIKTDHIKIAPTKSTDKHINTLLSNKFQPMMNANQSVSSAINTKDKLILKPVRFSFSKDSHRRDKSNISSPRRNNDNSSIFIGDLIEQVESYDYQGDSRMKPTLPITSIRSTTMVNLFMQQQKTKNRYSSSTNEWRLRNNNTTTYITQYHDLDQPEE